jgi:hypothetical protein
MELVPGDMGMAFMDTIVEGLPRIQQKNTSTPIKAVDLTPVTDVLSDPKTENYAYVGSLTQPPCSEGVYWVVSHQTFPITVQQFNALKGFSSSILGIRRILSGTEICCKLLRGIIHIHRARGRSIKQCAG